MASTSSMVSDGLEQRLEKACKLSTTAIEHCLPPSLLEDLKRVGRCLSVPWLGLLVGLVQPVQYVLGYASVEIEETDWWEPTIFWPIMHMPSATRKSVIYKFVKDVIGSLEEDGTEFQICETTFEKMGLLMEKNNGKMIWQFDEARHFFAQLGIYQKTPTRDEAILLSLYNGEGWAHSSAKGVQFTLPCTKLCIGGLTQTAHLVKLFDNQEQMESGLIPRFFTIMLESIHTSLRDMEKGSDDLKMKVINHLASLKDFHQKNNVSYILYRDSKAFEIFAQYDDRIEKWIMKYEYKMSFQHAITMVSKSKGQILRLSGILNAFFLSWDLKEVISFEKECQFVGRECDFQSLDVSEDDERVEEEEEKERSKKEIPISAMAMQCATSIVTYGLYQNLIIQGIDVLKFDTSMLQRPGHFFTETENPNVMPVSVPEKENKGSAGKKRQRSNTNGNISDIGMLMISGGIVLNGKKLNHYKKLGATTNKQRVMDAFCRMEKEGFGKRKNDNFVFSDDILNFIHAFADKQEFLVQQGITVSMFEQALRQGDQLSQPSQPKPSSNTLPMMESVCNQQIDPISLMNEMSFMNTVCPLPSYINVATPNPLVVLSRMHDISSESMNTDEIA